MGNILKSSCQERRWLSTKPQKHEMGLADHDALGPVWHGRGAAADIDDYLLPSLHDYTKILFPEPFSMKANSTEIRGSRSPGSSSLLRYAQPHFSVWLAFCHTCRHWSWAAQTVNVISSSEAGMALCSRHCPETVLR